MEILISSSDQQLRGTLVDNPTARSFAALLPLTVYVRDFRGTERIADLPERLDATGAPRVHRGQPGEITYFAPWGNLALFYGSGQFTGGLIYLGNLDPDALAILTELRGEVTITETSSDRAASG